MITKKVKTLRSLETHAQYEWQCALGRNNICNICRMKPIKTYKHWKIVENEFPYDEVASESHMITPLQHQNEIELSKEAKKEYEKIKKEIHEEYDMIVENTNKQKSIPGHHHLHLLRIKERIMMVRDTDLQVGFLAPEKMKTTA